MSDTFKYFQTQPTTLAGAGAGIGDTSIILQSFIDIEGALIAMTDFGTIAFGTIEPGGVNEEQISFAGITQNGNGTATLTTVKTVLFKYPYTQTSGLAKTHAGGTSFVISNTAGFYDKFVAKDDDETITGVHTYTQFPVTPSSAPTTDYQISNKKYVDDAVVAGAPDAGLTTKGISEEATAAEINAGTQTGSTSAQLFANPKYLKDSEYYTLRPTSDEKGALAGSGTPSAANKYVTADTDALKELLANKDTDGALAANSDTKYASQKATKTYSDAHTISSKTGYTTHDVSVTGTQTIAHGLGAIPKRVDIDVACLAQAGTCHSFGCYDGTNTYCVFSYGCFTNSVLSVVAADSHIYIYISSGNDAYASIAVDSTNITLTWSKDGTPTGSANLLWKVTK
jgi:hypothetical protein